MPRDRAKSAEEVVVYRADSAVCNACPVKAACTASDRGRTLQCSFYADYLDRVRSYRATEAYKKAMRKRQVWVEPLFAEAKEWHGLRRFRLRGLENANFQRLLVAAGKTSSACSPQPVEVGATTRAGASWPSSRGHGGWRPDTTDRLPNQI